jgi:diguanylate cyclase
MENPEVTSRFAQPYVWFSRLAPEREQALLRISIGSIVLFAYWIPAILTPSARVDATLMIVACYVAFGVCTWVATRNARPFSTRRLCATAVLDQGLVIAALAFGGRSALPLLWVVFWFLIGAGCRYGRRILAVSCATALAGLVGLIVAEPSWWKHNRPAGTGLCLAVLGVSVYQAVLVRRLELVNRQLEHRAATDPLTGLYNRTSLEQAMLRKLTEPVITRAPLAVLLIDLDGFKDVNDTYGHAIGDVLLQTFADGLKKNTRASDTVARLGGDEFVILAGGIDDASGLFALANKVQAVLAGIRVVAGHPVNVAASIGACVLSAGDAESTDVAAILRRADVAMYEAKARGRGETVIASGAA